MDSTYHPTVIFDFPSGNSYVIALVEEAGLDVHESQNYSGYAFGETVTEDLDEAVRTTIYELTEGSVRDDLPMEIERIEREPARVKIKVHFPGISDEEEE